MMDGGESALSVFHTRRLLQVIELPLEHSDETNVILEFASRCADEKQFQAFYCADKTLLLRSLEQDLHPRFWRVPWTLALERMQQASQPTGFNLNLPSLDSATGSSLSAQSMTAMNQRVVALEFSPEGDWLVVVVSWGPKMFLLVVPVASLVTRERKLSLQAQLCDGAPGELMSVAPSSMSTQMMSFLRAHGQNGAKYHSTVASDEEDLSVLEFSQGMTTPTCATWWRSFNGQNYILVGSIHDLISIVHVETNRECCRCELSGAIEDIQLVHGATATTMLVKTKSKSDETSYFKVLLEMKKESNVVTTFPDHFLEDKAFRPQRIKRFPSTTTLHVVQESTFDRFTSHLAVYEPSNDNSSAKVSFYSSDFAWTLVSECNLPITTDMHNVQVHFCSSQLILIQASYDSHNVAAWVSHRVKSPEIHASKVVHTLKLREDEGIRRAVVGRTLDVEADMLYFLHTDHQIYECRPKWTRVTLFQALHARSLHVQDAVFIGHAMGIDMASLCEVVADTICADHQPEQCKKMSRNSCEWIMRLYAKSRVVPSKAMDKLVAHGGLQNAIEYARETLAKPDVPDREFLAHTLIDSALKLYQTEATSSSNWDSLYSFLETNKDYQTAFAIQRCVATQCVDGALHVGHYRHAIDAALRSLQEFGRHLSPDQVTFLLDHEYASKLTAPDVRVLFRALPLSLQFQTMVAHPPALLLQRDYIVRILPELTDDEAFQLATTLDPRLIAPKPLTTLPNASNEAASDVMTSEAILVTLEEKVELFLTVLLRLHSKRSSSKPCSAKNYTHDDLISLLKLWSKQYRPPILVMRCSDYGDWAAAAACYEAQGEWVDAIECKLHMHEERRVGSSHKTRHIMPHEDLVDLMQSLVFTSKNSMAAAMKRAVLARLILHWNAMEYDLSALEAFLLKQSDLSPVAQILFTAVDSFDERDREFITQCQRLPLSGVFYLKVCEAHVASRKLAASSSQQDVARLIDTVLENLERHYPDVAHFKLERQTPTRLGQNDPIETHARVFSCGHAFPRRVFDDDVVPLFEKKMAALSLPNTTQMLLQEYRKPKRIEAPCPVCAFSRLQTILAQPHKRSINNTTRETPRPRVMTAEQWIWK
ncbi:hypothetical protein AeRB84_021409 [Aphanomyces euteiches]|nr:hypothetical protein AeRB84_021409 [Aphanomyces euteiches]